MLDTDDHCTTWTCRLALWSRYRTALRQFQLLFRHKPLQNADCLPSHTISTLFPLKRPLHYSRKFALIKYLQHFFTITDACCNIHTRQVSLAYFGNPHQLLTEAKTTSINKGHINTRNKSNDTSESLQYRQDVRHIAHYRNRKSFHSYTRCSENHNNTCAENRKIRGLKFDTQYWRHLAAYLNMGAQLHIIPYKKPPKHFLNCTT